jgi:bifunctional DNA-binding transcriptional regulator/antitoxin component of YhaV-PrlF toxin-antitoxin module
MCLRLDLDETVTLHRNSNSADWKFMRATAKIVDGGRLLLPVEIWRAMGLKTGDTVSLILDGQKLEVRSTDTVIREIQEMLKPYRRTDGRSVVDDLIAERRREAQ